ncbi:amino acid adenylation domain-containing protein [Lysinibacillus xylanilyticus]|uniref:non-ribosomal peptide synthetase n=1 Tax=Lysinibacillus xylanilyticus TaxID=582475 RepID=UPI002B23EF3E|nr:non-ribosomal peptide synthetase [Lysinibacillus xylanilyticus]MEB2302389.1 amino acid adenylation domain-containing protein [Lysinibacillus xylanilyticus]
MFSKDKIQDICLLTPMQESIIYFDKRAESDNNNAYFQQIHTTIKGELNITIFRQAVAHLVEKYNILRTAFLSKGVHKPVQIILKEREIEVNYEDLTELSVDKENFLENVKAKDRERGVVLLNDPLVRISVFKEAIDHYSILFTFHHIILDGWSLANLVDELKRVYSELIITSRITVKEVKQFPEYVSWLSKQDKESARDYWRNYLADYKRKASLYTHNRTVSNRTANYQKVIHVLDEKKMEKLHQISNQYGLTLASIFNAMWGIILQKYNRTKDVVFANVVSGRNVDIDGIEEMVGMFINSVPVRVKTNEQMTLRELLLQVNKDGIVSTEYSYLSLSEIQSLTELNNNLIDHVLIFENYPFNQDILRSSNEKLDFQVKQFEINGHSNYDFNLTIYAGKTVTLSANVNTNLYDVCFVENVLEGFNIIVDAVIEDLNIVVDQIDLVSKRQKATILSYSRNYSTAEHPTTVDAIFKEVFQKNAEQPAVLYQQRSLTYQELDKRTNQLARKMQAMGFKQGDVIGVDTERSLEMIVALVAIIKAGGVYLPLNSYYPENVLHHILEENGAAFVLTHHNRDEERVLYPKHVKSIAISLEREDLYSGDDRDVISKSSPSHLLYLLYTSGTTGKPKGVGVENRQLINTIHGLEQEIYQQYPSHLRIGLIAPNFFDASIKQIFASLLLGHQLCIVDEETRFNGKKLLEFIISEEIDVIDGTPSHLRMMSTGYELIEKGKLTELQLKCLVIGGEALLMEDVRNFLANFPPSKFEVINVYGLTETTVDTTIYRINQENMQDVKQIPIGKPLANQSVLILDDKKRLVPIGVEGEIYIGGNSVARGYIYDPDLQRASYVTVEGFGSDIFYKTADLGLWTSDGNILYRGRIDSQVKIRGYRIELMEVEHAFHEFDDIRDIVVLAVERNNSEYLHAYFVSERSIDVYELRNFLIDKLPQYMVPSFYSQLEEMPVKTNGKVDKEQLREFTGKVHNLEDYEAPSNQTEAKLTEIWKKVLGLDKISIHDNFFSIGGHSLKAMEIMMQIGKEFRIDIPFKYFFDHPTIQKLSDYIRQASIHTIQEIKAADKKEYYPASSQQKRMYTFFKYDPKSIVYNIVGAYKISGEIDYRALQESLDKLVKRHEILRTLYKEIDGQVVQQIIDEARIVIQYGKVNDIQSFQKYIKAFDLNKEIPFEIHLLGMGQNESILLLNMHHISFDGISVSIFLEELFSLYSGGSLKPLRVQYKDLSSWERDNSHHKQEQETYWRKTLDGELPVLNVPLDYQRPATRDYRGSYIDFEFDADTLQILKEVSAETEATLYAVLFSLFNLTLYKYTGQKDFITGTITSGRYHPDMNHALGMFVNTSVIRSMIDETVELKTFIQKQKDTILEMLEHQKYPFEDMLELLNVQVEKYRNPIFDVLFSFNNYTDFKLPSNLRDIRIEEMDVDSQTTKFDMALMGTEKQDKLVFRLEYSNQLFKRELMEKLVNHFSNVIQISGELLQEQLRNIPFMDNHEKNQLLHEFNNTDTDYSKEKSLKDLFEEQCLLTPTDRALVYNEESLSYQKLNYLANQIAHYLQDEGIKTEEVVGVSMEQGFNRIATILGIIKAGAAFLPIDETYPEERITYMLKDSNAKLLLTEETFQVPVDVKVVPVTSEVIQTQSITNPKTHVLPNNLAYIMYTSGSTGQSKGVMVEHRNVVRLVKNTNYITFQESDRMLQGSTIVFDASTLEIWGALLNGIELHLVDKEIMLNPEKLGRVLEKEQITILWMTASLFNQVSKENPTIFKNLRYLLVGGDALLPEPIEKVRQACLGVQIINGYGPTENTTFSTTQAIDKTYTYNIPIGKPIANSTAYILDSHLNLQPIGAIGEIYVGGAGVARGYLNNETLTRERFIDNPFAPGEQLYRTGDIGRWLADGSIEYLGRADQQMKIRGFRIELGEIVNTLLLHPHVKDATVLQKENDTLGKYITAYVVLEERNTDADLESVWDFIKKKLPDYMQPSFIIEIDEIPLTLNGKVNKQALLSYEEESAIVQVDEPITVTEEKLLTIWKDVFKKEKIGTNNDFFRIGGNSIIAIELLAKVKQAFKVDVSIRELFSQSTIKSIAQYIDKSQPDVIQRIPKAKEKSLYAVTMAQEKLYALQMVEKDNLAYNMPQAFTIRGDLDVARLKHVFEKLIRRHEAFRTSFHREGNQIVQRIHHKMEIDFEFKEISKSNSRTIIEESIQPFELSKAPLVRMKVFAISHHHFLLFLDMHHIISDGTSLNYVIDELFTAYRNKGQLTEEPMAIQQKDFAEWQKYIYEQPEMKEKEHYWLKTFREIPESNLPYDYLKTKDQSFDGSYIPFDLGSDAKQKIEALALKYGCTPNVVLLSVFTIVLSIYSQQEEVVIGTAVNGRKQREVDRTIGMFTRMLPLKNKVQRKQSIQELIDEVQNNLLTAIDHQEYEGEKLLDELNVFANRGENTLFNVVFTHDKKKQNAYLIPGLDMEEYPLSFQYAKYDLVFSVTESDKSISLELLFNPNLFRQGTIKRIIASYKHIFTQLEEHQQLSTFDMIPNEERNRLIHEFNATTVPYPLEKSVVDHFMEVVSRFPNKIAVVDREKEITYQQLDERATIVAMKLIEQKVERQDIVAILMEPDLDLPVAMLGILKAGAAFLTIDPNYPEKRIKYILRDSNCKLLITKKGINKPVTFSNTQLLMDEIEWVLPEKKYVLPNSLPTDLAYVIYTSGTTGNPKGVMIEQPGLVNLCYWHQETFDVTERDRASKYATVGFDATVWELFPYLLKGASIYFVEEQDKLDMERLNAFFEKHQITISFLPTQIAEQFMKVENHSLRTLLIGGDRLKEFKNKPYQIVNNYGPTENTVVTTSHLVTENANNISIGKPIANTKIYILDDNHNLQPIGVPGELCIVGVGLARGYLGRQELNAEKFVDNPIEQLGKMYKTGDIAKWNEDGIITFLGRNDNQLKIRGNRVEISEIEAAMLQVKDIEQAVVVARKDGLKDPILVAYITVRQNLDVKKVKKDLKLVLPHFMVPAHIIFLDNLPITTNGKVDRKRLLELDLPSEPLTWLEPATEFENQLYSVWCAVLNREDFGREDDFFELGGDSLKTVYLLGEIREHFQVESSISEIYEYSTIESYAKLLESKQPLRNQETLSIDSIKDGMYPLSPAQRRIFIQDHYNEQSTLYNIPTAYRMKGHLDRNKLEWAFKQLLERHESLRSSFFMKDQIVQKIEEQVEFQIDRISSDGKDIKATIQSLIKPFDLQKAPLLRVAIIEVPDDDNRLFIDLHHIICDGVSLNILLRELEELYSGKMLTPLQRNYLEYITWQNQYYESMTLAQQRTFWNGLLSGYDNKDIVPIDFPRELRENYDSQIIRFSLPADVYERLMALTKKFKCSPFAFMTAVYVVLLHKYSNRDDLIVGCVTAGRQHPNVKQLVGMFTNTLPIRYFIDKEKPFSDFLATVNKSLLQAYDHQDFQFDDMVKDLQMEQFVGKTPLIDMLFQFQDLPNHDEVEEGIGLEPYEIGVMNSKFDLEIYGQQHEKGMTFSVNYRTNLFKQSTINQLILDYQQLVEVITWNANEKIKSLNILSTGKWEKKAKDIFEKVVFDV